MAGTLEARTPDAKHYVDYEEYVDFQLEKTRSSIKLTDIFTTLTTLAVAVIGYLLVFVFFDQWVLDGGFGYTSRVCLLTLLMVGVLGTLAWRVLLPLLRRVHPLYAARVIERSDPNLKSNLVNFVDVRRSNAESAPMVLKAMEKRAAVELSHIDVEEAVDRRPLLRIAYALLGVVVVAALYIIFSPKDPFASVRRALLPTAAIDVATETTISDWMPGDKDVPARTELTIEADVRGKDADHAQILYTTADHKYVDQAVEMKRIEATMPRFRGVLNGENGHGLLQSLKYRIVAGDARTREFAINVIQPPSARVDEVQYEYPTYMQLENTTTQGGDIDGWDGTKVTVRATTNVPVKSATVVLTDIEDTAAKGEEISMEVADGTKLSMTWNLKFRDDGTAARFYHIRVKTANGEIDPAPTLYSLRIRPDQRPEVALLAPTSDLEMPANGIIPLVIQATDPDFQLRSITLKSEKGGDGFPDLKLFHDQNLGQTFRGNHDFRLEPLRLSAGDTIQFWIEVRDNKQPTANRANTPRINVHIGKPASPQAVQQELAKEKQKQQEELNRADDARNPDKVDDLPPPSETGDDEKEDPPQRRPDPGDERPKDERKAPEREPEVTPNSPDKENQDQPGQQKKPAPDSLQQALEKLVQKEGSNRTPATRSRTKNKNHNRAMRKTRPKRALMARALLTSRRVEKKREIRQTRVIPATPRKAANSRRSPTSLRAMKKLPRGIVPTAKVKSRPTTSNRNQIRTTLPERNRARPTAKRVSRMGTRTRPTRPEGREDLTRIRILLPSLRETTPRRRRKRLIRIRRPKTTSRIRTTEIAEKRNLATRSPATQRIRQQRTTPVRMEPGRRMTLVRRLRARKRTTRRQTRRTSRLIKATRRREARTRLPRQINRRLTIRRSPARTKNLRLNRISRSKVGLAKKQTTKRTPPRLQKKSRGKRDPPRRLVSPKEISKRVTARAKARNPRSRAKARKSREMIPTRRQKKRPLQNRLTPRRKRPPETNPATPPVTNRGIPLRPKPRGM